MIIKNRIILLGVCLVVLLSFSVAFSKAPAGDSSAASFWARPPQTAADSALTARDSRPAISDYFVRVGWVTLLIILFILVGFSLYKRYGIKAGFIGKSNIRVLSKYHIGPKQYLMLIWIEGRKLLIGVSDKSMSLLADLGAADEAEINAAQQAVTPPNFASILQRFKKSEADR